MKKLISILFVMSILGTSVGCTTGQNQALGVGGGAVLGGIAGSALTGGSAVGTIVGAGAGGLVGYEVTK
ncbi:MAG TPA: osmotically inducible lipoprotein OsmB [Gammaproteobacteria bacterium]|jgi:osmotically inducible lipoprotein OsmB|nr:osmotically inducible lipoprotein OsmB [Gammaproteobacteria bacterium]